MISEQVYEELRKERDSLTKAKVATKYVKDRLAAIRKTLKDAHRDKYKRERGNARV